MLSAPQAGEYKARCSRVLQVCNKTILAPTTGNRDRVGASEQTGREASASALAAASAASSSLASCAASSRHRVFRVRRAAFLSAVAAAAVWLAGPRDTDVNVGVDVDIVEAQ